MQKFLRLLSYIGLIFCMICCHAGGKRKLHDISQYAQMVRNLEDDLNHRPVEISNRIDSLLGKAEDSLSYYQLLTVKAKAKMFSTEIDSSVAILNRIETFCTHSSIPEHERLLLQANVHNIRGNLYARRVMMDSACVEFSRSYDYCVKVGDEDKRMDVMLNLADAYVRSGRYDWGSYWYRRFLTVADSLQLPEERRFPAYYGLAQVNMDLQNFDQCDYYFNLAGKFFDKMDPSEKHIYLNNRGNSYYYREDYETALKYFKALLAFLQGYPEMEFERNLTMVNLGEVYLLTDKTDSAAYYLDRCRTFFQEMKNNSALYYIDTQLIELALKEGNLPLAERRMKEAVKLTYVEPNMLRIRNKYLQHYFSEKGDYERAYHYLLENHRIDDSTLNERVKMRTAEIVLRYRQDSTLMKKEVLIRQKENAMLRLRQGAYVAVGSLILIGLLVAGRLLVLKRRHEKAAWKMQNAIMSLRLENIRNRISPHFIFNVLNREVAAGRRQHSDNLMELIKLMRRNLELTEGLAVSLADELDFVQTYINLEGKTLGDDFIYLSDIDPSIDLQKFKVPSMLLQIPVENSIKHALSGKEGRKCLWINGVKKDTEVELVVRDNGGGYGRPTANKGTGTGMKVITQTIQLLNTYNSTPIVMTISNVPVRDGEVGCEVHYSIPLEYSYKLNQEK